MMCVIRTSGQATTYTYGFETQLTHSPWVSEGGENQALVVEDPTNPQNRVLRALLPLPAPGNVWKNSNTRSEIRWQKGTNDIPNWFSNGSSYSYQFRVYVPDDHICDPTTAEIIAQWHSPRGSEIKSSPISIRIQDCQIMLMNRSSDVQDGDNSTVSNNLYSSGIHWTKGSWHYFIIDIRFDYMKSDNGWVRVFMDTSDWPSRKDLIMEHQGGVGYRATLKQNFKLGVYKWRWKFRESVAGAYEQDPPIINRVYYYDDITIKKGLHF